MGVTGARDLLEAREIELRRLRVVEVTVTLTKDQPRWATTNARAAQDKEPEIPTDAHRVGTSGIFFRYFSFRFLGPTQQAARPSGNRRGNGNNRKSNGGSRRNGGNSNGNGTGSRRNNNFGQKRPQAKPLQASRPKARPLQQQQRPKSAPLQSQQRPVQQVRPASNSNNR